MDKSNILSCHQSLTYIVHLQQNTLQRGLEKCNLSNCLCKDVENLDSLLGLICPKVSLLNKSDTDWDFSNFLYLHKKKRFTVQRKKLMLTEVVLLVFFYKV